MRVRLDRDEWWPVYTVEIPGPDDASGLFVAIPEELHERYLSAMAEFVAVQGELSRLWVEL